MRNLNPAQLLELVVLFLHQQLKLQLLLICIRIHMHSRTQLAPSQTHRAKGWNF